MKKPKDILKNLIGKDKAPKPRYGALIAVAASLLLIVAIVIISMTFKNEETNQKAALEQQRQIETEDKLGAELGQRRQADEVAKRKAELEESRQAEEEISKLASIPSKFRSKARVLSINNVKSILKKYNLFDKSYHSSGKGLDNLYKVLTIKNDKVVIDHATGLMWQQSGSQESMTFEKAEVYITDLNRNGFAGFRDWRLPTLEEAMSLMEPVKNNGGWYIDPAFNAKQRWIWISDKITGGPWAWGVDFSFGNCTSYFFLYDAYVRPVRSG